MALRPVEFHILLALAADERHGYSILQEVAELTDGDLTLEPGTLYRALHRMLKDGWIVETDRRLPRESEAGRRGPRDARPGDRGPRSENIDERRRYYRLTPLGRRVATAEADRLWRLLAVARRHRLLTRA
jgi:DNA-binding PadR family transcriptional regulator